MVKNMRVNTKMAPKQAKESSNFLTEVTTKDNFSTIRSMVKVLLCFNSGVYVWCKNRKYEGEW